MRERNNQSGGKGASDNTTYSVDMLREIYHSDPKRRCQAAMQGWGLDVLKDDEVWLVRHFAKRMLRRQELEKEGIILSPGDVEYTDAHIDDMVYELYKADWVNKNTTPETRMQSIRDWSNGVIETRENELLPFARDAWLAFYGYPCVEGQTRSFYDNFYTFLGYHSPEYKGLYHDREYVAELLGHDEKLLALYDADINDDKELFYQSPSIGERLAEATERSEQARHSSASKDEFTLA